MITVPLAERMRPTRLAEVAGQRHLVGERGMLRLQIERGVVTSMILWGPPGTGKTSLARIIAESSKLPFHSLSAISSGVKEIREVILKASESGRILLFIDEIHRFSKSQQDSLLAAVENGTLVLVGATTENPSFEIIRPLLSRSQVYILEPLEENDLRLLIDRALEVDEALRGVKLADTAYRSLIAYSGGDARRMLNLLELSAKTLANPAEILTDEKVRSVSQARLPNFDKQGEMHYDLISAMIKSIRGSDPNAALYWMIRLTEAGEDPQFIARRLCVLASEDIGNANPNALLLATAAFEATRTIGYPECVLNLSHAVVYLAGSAKSNAVYKAMKGAQKLVRETGDQPVPLSLRNPVTGLMEKMGYGKEYIYPHDYPNHFIDAEYMPEELVGTILYEPASNPREQEIRSFLRQRWEKKYKY